ncbi:MAG: ornithine carbamoyltransferase [Candidatus Omnitrophota bacterium]|nr:MAG: ornithine carbamoyltransferase [Candidatus Omnitrophota bacterium]
MKKDFISVEDLTYKEIEHVFTLTASLKKERDKFSGSLRGKALGLIFQKPSCRTRASFEVGMYQLGGYSIYLGPDEINLGVRETIKDAAMTLSRYVDAIVLRTFEHKNVVEMAEFSSVPVINGLSDLLHPCQALADIYTIKEKLKKLKGLTLAYIGDGNNVCHSLIHACDKSGMNMNVAAPEGYEPNPEILKAAKGAKIRLFKNAIEAASNTDVIYTDVWASMGKEKEAGKRKKAFRDFQINSKILKTAKSKVLVMHCLPAHRGQEITDDVIDGEHSIVFDQAENRMHVQKAILIMLLKGKK